MKRLLQKNTSIIIPILFFLFSFLYNFHDAFYYRLNVYDEGLAVYSSLNYFFGNLPYRNYYSEYPPGHSIILAIVFKIFGLSLSNFRAFDLFLNSLVISLSIYFILGIGKKWQAILSGLLLVYFPPNNHFGALVFTIINLILLSKFQKSKNSVILKYAGLMIGILSFFRIDFAFYCFTANIIFLLARTKYLKTKGSSGIYPLTIWTFIGTIPSLIFYLYLSLPITIKYMIFTSIKVMRARDLPMPSFHLASDIINLSIGKISLFKLIIRHQFSTSFYLPLFIAFIFFAIFIVLPKKKKQFMVSNYLLPIITTILCSFYYLGRTDVPHLSTIYVFVAILTPFLLNYIYDLTRQITVPLIFLFITFLACSILIFTIIFPIYPNIFIFNFIFVFIVLLKLSSNKPHSLNKIIRVTFILCTYLSVLSCFMIVKIFHNKVVDKSSYVRLKGKNAGYILIPEYKKYYNDLIEYIELKSPTCFFSGSTMHDKISVNDIMLHFLTGIRSATYYWWFDPGIQSSYSVQKKIAEDISRNKCELIILWQEASPANEPNLSSVSSHIYLLDNFINDNFKLTKRFGDYFVLEKKNNNIK